MSKFGNIIIVRENQLTDELKRRCDKAIAKNKQCNSIKANDLKELHYLLNAVIDEKNQEYKKCIKDISKHPFLEGVEIATIPNIEAEHYVQEIFNILTAEKELVDKKICIKKV